MSKCDFTISINKQADETKKLIENKITEEGGNISFNNDKGKFDLDIIGGKVVGNLTIQDEGVHVKITNKPDLIPCSAIESVIKGSL